MRADGPEGREGEVTEVLRQRHASIRARVDAACVRVGRKPSDVRIVAVSKFHPAEAVIAAGRAGLLALGENYVQELCAKQDAVAGLARAGDPLPLEWHFIGRLQRNKVKQVVGRVALIHAVDSIALAAEIDRRAEERGIVQPILIAVSAAGEAQKSGIDAEQLEPMLDELGRMRGVEVRGLMTMPPLPEQPGDSRPYFRALCAQLLRLAGPGRNLTELSMGTTADLEVAVEEGATLLRVGTALFGERPPRRPA